MTLHRSTPASAQSHAARLTTKPAERAAAMWAAFMLEAICFPATASLNKGRAAAWAHKIKA